MNPGDLVERYQIEATLGSGGMANVYRATHTALGSTHAIKILNESLVADDDMRQRFLSEGRIQSQLRHPNIAAVTDIVATEKVAGLVMEYVEGPTLDEHIEEVGGALPAPDILAILVPVLDAVGAAHTRGIVHRDLKPENIIIGRTHNGNIRPVVLDFGIAKLSETASVDDRRKKKKTAAGMRMGTLNYMSPEQLHGAENVDHRTDIFALGAILYELATGQVAFHGDSEYDTMRRIVEGDYEPVARVMKPPNGALDTCIQTALQMEPGNRFSDCVQFSEALTKATQESQPNVKVRKPASSSSRELGNSASPEKPKTAPAPDLAVSARAQVRSTPPTAYCVSGYLMLISGVTTTGMSVLMLAGTMCLAVWMFLTALVGLGQIAGGVILITGTRARFIIPAAVVGLLGSTFALDPVGAVLDIGTLVCLTRPAVTRWLRKEPGKPNEAR